MLLLALETSTDVGSVAILENERMIAEQVLCAPMRLLSWLSPAISGILNANNLELNQLDAIATGVGPGSFTGVRLELATARTLAQVLKIPLYGISSLDALAFQGLPHHGTILSYLDARRGEWFAGIYNASGRSLTQAEEHLCASKETIGRAMEKYPSPYLLIGKMNDDLDYLRNHLRDSRAIDGESAMVRASAAGVLAYQRRHELSGNLHSVMPLYIRASSAELEKESKLTK